jgi:hypothetical protein
VQFAHSFVIGSHRLVHMCSVMCACLAIECAGLHTACMICVKQYELPLVRGLLLHCNTLLLSSGVAAMRCVCVLLPPALHHFACIAGVWMRGACPLRLDLFSCGIDF